MNKLKKAFIGWLDKPKDNTTIADIFKGLLKKTDAESLSDAISLSSQYHNTQTRWDGITPYIIHPIEVMMEIRKKFPDDLPLAEIAILHDVLEDTPLREEDLKNLVSDRVFKGVVALTKEKGAGYEEYINSITTNEDAVKVKIADIEVNSRIDKQGGTNKSYKEQGKRWAKYKKAYDILNNK